MALCNNIGGESEIVYLTTGRVEVAVEHVEDLINLARACRLVTLEINLDERRKRVESFGMTSFVEVLINSSKYQLV